MKLGVLRVKLGMWCDKVGALYSNFLFRVENLVFWSGKLGVSYVKLGVWSHRLFDFDLNLVRGINFELVEHQHQW